MKRATLGMVSAVMVLVLVGITSLSQAAGPAGMKLYAFSSGGLTRFNSTFAAAAREIAGVWPRMRTDTPPSGEQREAQA